jgi:hypothetical protein
VTAEPVFQAVFAGAAVLVAASFVAVLLRPVPHNLLKAGAVACAVAAVGGWIAFVFEPGAGLGAAAAGLTLCAVAEVGALVLGTALERRRQVEVDLARAEERLSRLIDEETERRATELARTLARARADASSMLAEEERKFAVERQRLIAEREERARTEIAEALSLAHQRAEQRVAALAGDLEQLQQSVRSEITRLGERQTQLMAEAERRLESDNRGLISVHEEQRAALARVRAELAEATEAAFATAKGEIDEHAAERRRALHEVSERLRRRERELREQIELEESEAAQRIRASFEDTERRQLDQLERRIDRAGERYVEAAEQQFDASIKTAREEAARRLGRELERSTAMFAHETESVLAERLSKIGDLGAQRLERRLTEGEAALAQRRDDLLAVLEQRMSEAETDVKRRLEALEGETDAERRVLEARLQELTRRVDELVAEAESRLASAVRSP